MTTYFSNRCICSGVVLGMNGGSKKCPECLQAASVYIPCHEAPALGELGVVEISQLNVYDVCPEQAVELKIVSSPGFHTAQIDANGDIEFQINVAALEPNSTLKIHYKVECPANGMAVNGFIIVCHAEAE